ncbi:hypothetical protein ACCO45_000568 [Purpureocillium lilacinum]|uniref:Uncharacterized protein n=1 Tax=Purpureocillium lilacinum TaxID=33203 RepID=A0ACC4E604_PURLI
MDAGLALLLRRHVDLPSLALTSVLEGFAGGLETSPSAIGVGCASEPSPMTAISPDSGSGTLPSFLGESLDQNAQVELAFGAGSGSGFGGGGGASSMTTSSGSLAVASLGAESCFADGALLELPRNPNQDDDGGGGSLLGVGGRLLCCCLRGGVACRPSSAASSGGGGGLAISASNTVFGIRDHQPSQLPVVGGRSGVAVGSAVCWSGTSWLPSLLSASGNLIRAGPPASARRLRMQVRSCSTEAARLRGPWRETGRGCCADSPRRRPFGIESA